jgi:hypothetical protein
MGARLSVASVPGLATCWPGSGGPGYSRAGLHRLLVFAVAAASWLAVDARLDGAFVGRGFFGFGGELISDCAARPFHGARTPEQSPLFNRPLSSQFRAQTRTRLNFACRRRARVGPCADACPAKL